MLGLLLLLLQAVSGCSGEPGALPQEQLRAVLNAAEREIEAKDLSAVMERVDPDYRDGKGRDKRQLRALLAGYFFRHPSIFVISRIEQIELIQPDFARVTLFAGLAGSAQEAAGPLQGWRGNLLRLELEFRQADAADWLLIKADWRPARREDFAG